MSTNSIGPIDLTMQMSEGGETYPFVEDENASITGYGHQDKAEFAAAINRYDTECNGEPMGYGDYWTADDIGWGWVTLNDDGETCHACAPGTPGAFPVTTLWGQR